MILDIACQDNLSYARKVYWDTEQRYVGLTIGVGSYIVDGSLEFGSMRGHVLVGNYSSLGHRIKFIIGLDHNGSFISTYPFRNLLGEPVEGAVNTYFEANRNQIIIGNDVWIGADVTILGGVRIGNGAVIGAGAVIARDVPPYAVVVGNPGKVIKYRFSPDVIGFLQELKWWNWDEDMIVRHWHEFERPQEFLHKYANMAQEKRTAVVDNGVEKVVLGLQEAGYKIYYLQPDLYSAEHVWEYALEKMQAKLAAGKVLLVLGIEDEMLSLADEKEFSKKLSHCHNDNIVVVGKKDEGKILPVADRLITTKEYESICLMGALSEDCQIVYAYDL